MTRLDIERTELNAFSAGVRAGTARNIELLNAIEHTLAWLDRLAAQLRADAEFADAIAGDLIKVKVPIDPEDAIVDDLSHAQTCVKKLYDKLIAKRQHWRNDLHITEEDGIEAAYTEAIAVAADLHNNINRLRWAIMEHDVDADRHQSDPALCFSDPDAIEAYLKSI